MDSQQPEAQKGATRVPHSSNTDNNDTMQNQEGGSTPIPVDDDVDMHDDAPQSWENFDTIRQGGEAAAEEPPKSAFSNDSYDSPVDPPQETEGDEDIWAGEEERTPPPRPETPLAKSDLEEEQEPYRRKELTEAEKDAEHDRRQQLMKAHMYSEKKTKDGEDVLHPFSGHQSSDDPIGEVFRRGRYGDRKIALAKPMPGFHDKKSMNWRAGRTDMSYVTEPSAEGFSSRDTDVSAGKAAETPLPASPDDARKDYQVEDEGDERPSSSLDSEDQAAAQPQQAPPPVNNTCAFGSGASFDFNVNRPSEQGQPRGNDGAAAQPAQATATPQPTNTFAFGSGASFDFNPKQQPAQAPSQISDEAAAEHEATSTPQASNTFAFGSGASSDFDFNRQSAQGQTQVDNTPTVSNGDTDPNANTQPGQAHLQDNNLFSFGNDQDAAQNNISNDLSAALDEDWDEVLQALQAEDFDPGPDLDPGLEATLQDFSQNNPIEGLEDNQLDDTPNWNGDFQQNAQPEQSVDAAGRDPNEGVSSNASEPQSQEVQSQAAQGHGTQNPPRPSSPITGSYNDSDIADYYSQDFTPEDEFDQLTGTGNGDQQQTAAQPSSKEDSDDPGEPPDSAEILKKVTGMSLEEGKRKFDRLRQLAESTIMQDPQRALEMKRQMFKYTYWGSDKHIPSIGKEGAKEHKKALDAWTSAAAHHYRHQREEMRAAAEYWQYDAGQQHKRAQQQQQIAEQRRRYAIEIESQLRHAEQEKEDLELAAEMAHEELRECNESSEKREQVLKKTRHQLTRAHPYWVKAMEEEKARREGERKGESDDKEQRGNRHIEASVQTSPTLVQGEQAASSSQQTEKPSDQYPAETPADDETQSSLSSDSDDGFFGGRGGRRGRRTNSRNDNNRSQGQNVQRPVHRLRFEVDIDVRSALIPEMARWINETHSQEHGDPGTTVSAERIETLIDGETTYDDFVSALRDDGLVFRHDRLASHIEEFINERRLGYTPLAILQSIYNITTGLHEPDVRRVYCEMAQRQVEVNRLSQRNEDADETAEQSRSELQVVAQELASSEDQLATAKRQNGQAQTVALASDADDSHQITAQAFERIDDLEKQNAELEKERDKLKAAREKRDDTANDEKANKLAEDLNACRQEGTELQQRNSQLESELEQARASAKEQDNDTSDDEASKVVDGLHACRKEGAEQRQRINQLESELKKARASANSQDDAVADGEANDSADELKDCRQERDELQERLNYADGTISRMQNDLDELQAQLEDTSTYKEELMEGLTKCAADVEKLEAEKLELEKQQPASKKDPGDEDAAYWKKVCEDMQKRFTDASQQVAELQGKLDEVPSEEEVEKLDAEFEQLRTKYNELVDQNDDLEKQNEECWDKIQESLEPENEKLKEEVERLSAENKQLRNGSAEPTTAPRPECGKEKREIERLTEENKRLSGDNDQLRSDNERLTHDKQRLGHDYQHLTAENKTLSEKNQDLADQVEGTEELNEIFSSENDGLKADNETLKAENSRLKDKNARLQQSNDNTADIGVQTNERSSEDVGTQTDKCSSQDAGVQTEESSFDPVWDHVHKARLERARKAHEALQAKYDSSQKELENARGERDRALAVLNHFAQFSEETQLRTLPPAPPSPAPAPLNLNRAGPSNIVRQQHQQQQEAETPAPLPTASAVPLPNSPSPSTANLLPSGNLQTPATNTYILVAASLDMRSRWRAREAAIRNTSAWRRTRDAALRELQRREEELERERAIREALAEREAERNLAAVRG